MAPVQMDEDDTPFDLAAGVAMFRGVRVQFTRVAIGGTEFEVVGLRDAADLLDDPEFAARFIEKDIAPHGLQLWPSSVALGKFLQSHVGNRRGTALELGCGLGLVSMVLARQGWEVTATDFDESALAFARYNAKRNRVHVASFERLDWRDPPEHRLFDLVVGADVTYQLVDQQPLLACLRSLLAPNGVAYLADPRRMVADGVPDAAVATGLRAGEVPMPDAASASGLDPLVRIWRLERAI